MGARKWETRLYEWIYNSVLPAYQHFAAQAQTKSQSHWSVEMSKSRAHPKFQTGCVSGLAQKSQKPVMKFKLCSWLI